jgi:hypothetical protein
MGVRSVTVIIGKLHFGSAVVPDNQQELKDIGTASLIIFLVENHRIELRTRVVSNERGLSLKDIAIFHTVSHGVYNSRASLI